MKCNDHKFEDIKAYKACKWCILSKNHAQLLLQNVKLQQKMFKIFLEKPPNGCLDEYTYLSILKHLNVNKNMIVTKNLSLDATTFCNWDKNPTDNFKDSIRTKIASNPSNYSYICPE